ncbi:MAG: zinc metallopeptidase, partial [Deltaproteobacteria bacterium]|nr:zinc metallopeptidase [Deltaproteobacteria bacterium]
VHCEDSNCIMHFTGLVEDLDKIPPYFCPYCAAALPPI